MRLNKSLDQQIAVFGESGSGKTVLLSSLYGATQEPAFLKSSLFNVVAEDIGQGNRLFKNYLGMRDEARVPEADRFKSTSYAFSIKLKNAHVKSNRTKPFDALRLIWHDYPGEWFEQDVSGPEEESRRVDTFRSLLGSDVALLLVDGRKLLDHAGEEERYLKSLLANFRNGLLRLKDQVLPDGKPLLRFPRIWMFALAKADLLPEFDVFNFRDLVISKVHEELAELRNVLEGFVEAPQAMSVGEDFLLLSSAKFEPNKIQLNQRIGIDLLLPVAAILPFERHISWVEQKQLGSKVAEVLLSGSEPLADAILGKIKFTGPISAILGPILNRTAVTIIASAAELGGEQLAKRNADAKAKHDYLAAALTGFQIALHEGEENHTLLRRPQ